MKHTNKKGFTIVELVIVIAVIAILAAVLIPTFTNLIKKANESSDIQAVRQMNTILAAEGAVEKNNIFDVFDALHESNLDAKNYKPLVSGHYFFWDDKADCIVYTDANYDVIFPKDYDKATKGNWFSLTQTIEAKKPTNYTTGADIEVKSGAELLYVLNDIEEKKPATAVITVPADGIDMMGASFGIDNIAAGTSLTIQGADGKQAALKNVIAVDVAYIGEGKSDSDDGQYYTSLFPKVEGDLTISNVVFENIHVKNTHASCVALLVGKVQPGATVNISGVEIKDSTVIGHRNVGALVGNIQGNTNTGKKGGTDISGEVTISNVTMTNVSVLTVGGRSGLLVGVLATSSDTEVFGKVIVTGDITLTNCKYDMYTCEQNTGDGYGLKDGVITSWYYSDNTGTKKAEYKKYCFDANALASKDVDHEGVGGETANDAFDGRIK